MAGPKLYSYQDISDATGIRPGTLRVWLQRGHLPAPDYRLGQSPAWRPETIRPWIRANRIPGHDA